MGLAATGRIDEGRLLLERVVESLTTVYGMALPIVTIATVLPERAEDLRVLLEDAAQPQGDRINKALLAFVDAPAAVAERARRGEAVCRNRLAADGSSCP